MEAADVAKMTLYNHFASKDELVAAWLEWRHRDPEERLDERLAAPETPAERILVVFDAYLDSATEPGHRVCVSLNAAAEMPAPEHPARPVVRSHKDGVRDFLVEQATELGADDPTRFGEQLFVVLEGGVVTAGLRGDAEPIRAARAAAEILLFAARQD